MSTMQVISGLVFTAPGCKQGFIVTTLEKGYVTVQPFDDECCYQLTNSDGKLWCVPHEQLTDTSQWIVNEEPKDWFPPDLIKELSAISTKGLKHSHN